MKQTGTRALISASGVLALAMLAASGANYILNLALARMLARDEFGDASLLVTWMLALTSIAVGLQLVTVKVTAGKPEAVVAAAARVLRRRALRVGVVVAALLVLGAPLLRDVLNTASATPFAILGVGVPAYLVLAVDRGLVQGKLEFGRLAASYVVEAVARVGVAVTLVAAGLGVNGATWGLTVSFFAAGVTVARRRPAPAALRAANPPDLSGVLGPFALLLVAQVVINNGDVILSKRFFEPDTARAAYAVVALVGRAVFFVSWAVVQAVFPATVSEDGADPRVLRAGIALVAGLGAVSVALVFATAPTLAPLLFGSDYASIAPMLGPYAAAAALFAVVNVITTADVGRGKTAGAAVMLAGALVQTVVLAAGASSPERMVSLQVVVMLVLLVATILTTTLRPWQPVTAKVRADGVLASS